MSATPDSTLEDPKQTIADLRRERDEGLAREAAFAEVLQVINSSPGNLAPVFAAILENAHTLCGAEFGSLQAFDGEQFRAAATRGLPEAFAELLRGGYRPLPGSPAESLLRGEHYVHIVDMVALLADSTPAVARRLQLSVDLAGTRTLLLVPLRKDGVLLGFIGTYRKEVRPFTDKQIALLQNFAAQAVIAMENARLLTETREALEQQTATAEILRVINSSPGDLAPVFDAVLKNALHLCGAALGELHTFDGAVFRTVAIQGGSPEFVELRMKNPPNPSDPGTISARILQTRRPVHVLDMKAEDVRNTRRGAQLDLSGARSFVAVPLLKDEAVFGYVTMYRREVRPFTDKQIALLQNFAAQAVIAMENARLITETREALEQQTATAEVLGVINASPGELTPVFDAMLDKAMKLCEAAFGTLWARGIDSFVLAAHHGVSPELVKALREPGPHRGARDGSALRRLIEGEPFVQSLDIAAVDELLNAGPRRRALVELGGARASLWVALRKDDRLVGMLHVYRREVRPFSDKQIALLQNFAAQAVIAMENARLLGELRQRTEEVAELNRGLEARVAEQVEELGRVGRLKRFLAPQLAELIVSRGDEKILESHRREIVVVFCDLRGYTAFTETAEPEEVLDFLREYHGALGPLVSQFEGTLDQFSGDGIMVFFSDPVPIPDPAERAVRMTLAMREAAAKLTAAWRRRGRELGFGAGIAQGYATLGQIGFAERSGYTAIGTVCNVAARLCAEAEDGQILLSQRVAVAVEGTTTLEEIGALTLKGLTQPVVAYNVRLATGQPAFSVIQGGPQSV